MTMKKIAAFLLCPLFVSLSFTSCLPEGEETELTSTVALLSFKINDLKTRHTIPLSNGKDSTYTSILAASNIRFTIDHQQGLVYNSDSIAYGTDVKRVVTKLSANGYVYYHKDGERTGYNAEDSIDFTNPVMFTIQSYDGRFSRDYRISINVHKVDNGHTHWEWIKGANFRSNLYAEQRALIKEDTLYVLGKNHAGRGYTTHTAVDDGTQWSDPAAWTGIEGNIDCSSAILHNGCFYLLAGGVLHSSKDGIAWQKANTEGITCLLGNTYESTSTVWGLIDNTFASSTDMSIWKAYGQDTEKRMNKRIAAFSQPLRTNTSIYRNIIIGTDSLGTDTCAQVWSKLSTDSLWTEIAPSGNNTYGCPNLEQLAVVQCHNQMYAFGGKSIGNRHVPIAPFSYCYESLDNGITWRIRNDGFTLHPSFVGSTDTFSAVADDRQRIWIIWNTSGQIWRATWNKN
jgi:hypothetical protein